MQKIVEIPGIGNVEFPDSMTDDQISEVLRKQMDPNAAIKEKQANYQSPVSPNAGWREVMQDQSAAAMRGMTGGLIDHPLDTLGNAGKSVLEHPLQSAWDLAKGIVTMPVTGAVAGARAIENTLRGGAALVGGNMANIPMDVPTDEENIAAAEGAGQFLASAPAIAGATKLGNGIFKAAKSRFNPPLPATTIIEERLAPSTSNALLARDTAKDLAHHTDLVTAPADKFDELLFSKFKDAGAKVRSVESSIPDATPVPKQPILDGLQDLREQFESMASDKGVAVIDKQINRIKEMLPNSISRNTVAWDQFGAVKQSLGKTMKDLGVWKRIANGTAKQADIALSRSYGQLMQSVSEISPELAAANKTFSTFHDALLAAGMDAEEGRRIASIGKHVPTVFEKAKVLGKKALPYAAAAGLGGEAIRRGVWR